jgi:hypothetical protein
LGLCGVGIKRAVAPGSRATWKVNKAKMTRTATITAYERWKSISKHSVCAKHGSYGRGERVTSGHKAHSSLVSTLLIRDPEFEIRCPSSHRMGHYYWKVVDLRTSSFAWTRVVEQGYHRVTPSQSTLRSLYLSNGQVRDWRHPGCSFYQSRGRWVLHRVLTSATHICTLRKSLVR